MSSESLDSGYESPGSPTLQDSLSRFGSIGTTAPANQITRTLPFDIEKLALDEVSPVHCSDTVELLPVMGPDGKATSLIFKTLPPSLDDDENKQAWAWKTIENESHVFASVPEDPKLVKSYGVQNINGRKGLLLERIQGPSLEQRFKELRTLYLDGQLTRSEYMCANKLLTKQAAQCLKHLQDAGFMHGDFKPDNLLYDTTQNRLRLIDLGTSTRFDEVASPGHELYADPAAVSFKVMDKRRFQPMPPDDREVMTDELREKLPRGAQSDPKMDVYGLGQMAYIQGFTQGEETQMFTMGADLGSFRSGAEYRIHYLYTQMPDRYRDFDVLPAFSHDFPKKELDTAMALTRKAMEIGGDYYSFINSTLSPLRDKRATIDEVLDSSFLKLNKHEMKKAERVLRTSSEKFQALKASAQQQELVQLMKNNPGFRPQKG
ncbi:protein kinase domain-containing protein [Endozoicomonas arenosclerae]|uniref:protein kinase domain-containing protein n=1 Tax=Endozoicomonas arenosclerae TaxID=1633495 RepID=UPI00078218EA|nr:serine/threonine-protein kinase [Endozoicomonas arenosclerae]